MRVLLNPVGERNAKEPIQRGADHRLLKEAEAGRKVADVCREHGISEPTFYRWKSKYSGLDVSDAKKLRALEDENRRLKQLVAEQQLDNQALKAALGKKW